VPRQPDAPQGWYAGPGKRACDVVAATLLVVLLAPVMALVWLAVRFVLGPPALYVEERAGRDGRPIRILKFRSMRQASDAAGRPLPDADRLGAFGKVLRRTSLDELPQLFSVLRGDMSMVGPRPLPLRYLPRYNERQAARLLVRPGITGWAQIHGRNAVDWPRRLEYDVEYVTRLAGPLGPSTDLWIVCVTVFQVLWQGLTGRGIVAPGSATMQEFQP
jgi:lipopolysaccharide/colanic/teichoic acid biosynthesis glycosyltransferase